MSRCNPKFIHGCFSVNVTDESIGSHFYNLSNIFDLSRCTSPINSLCCTQTSCNWYKNIGNTSQIRSSFFNCFAANVSNSDPSALYTPCSLLNFSSFPNNTDRRVDITSQLRFVHITIHLLLIPCY